MNTLQIRIVWSMNFTEKQEMRGKAQRIARYLAGYCTKFHQTFT